MSINFPDEEIKVLELWNSIDAFHRQLELSASKKPFTFYDGPPFATGTGPLGNSFCWTC